MDIHSHPMSLLALEYKRISYLNDRKSRNRMSEIFLKIKNQYIGVLKNKQRELPLGDQSIMESQFEEWILYAITRWSGKSPFGGYLSVCFKGLIRCYCKEISPVNRSEHTSRTSYDIMIDKIIKHENDLDYDDAGFYDEDTMISLGDLSEEVELIDYSEIDDTFERWKVE